MIQIPVKPSKNPMIAFTGTFEDAVNKLISTSHKGKMAAMIEANPAGINFTPQVDKPLLKTKFKQLKTNIVIHSFFLGNLVPLIIK